MDYAAILVHIPLCVSLAAFRMDVWWAGMPEVVEYKIQMECQKAVQMCTTMKECARAHSNPYRHFSLRFAPSICV